MSERATRSGARDRAASLGFAVIGAGFIGRIHAEVIEKLDGAHLACIVDTDPARAEALAADHGDVATFASLEDALAGAPVQAVAICTPTGVHGEGAIAALRAGLHTVIEKPAEVTLAHCDEIIAAAEAAGPAVKVAVISQHRFDPSTEIVLDQLERGGFGTVTSGIASTNWWRGQDYYDSGDWRGTWELDGGGALMNQGIHAVDLLIAMMGRPVQVFAQTGLLAHERIDVEDTAVAVVTFDSGAIGVLHATTAAFPGLTVRVSLMGSRGSAIIDNDELVYVHAATGDIGQTGYGADPTKTNQVAEYARRGPVAPTYIDAPGNLSDAHVHQYRDFLSSIRDDRPPRVGLAENRRCLAVIEAVYESARTGQPVRVDD